MLTSGRGRFIWVAIILIIITVASYLTFTKHSKFTVKYERPRRETLLHSGEILKINLLKGGWQEFFKTDYHLFVHKAFIEYRRVWHRNSAVIVIPTLLRGEDVYEFNVECSVKRENHWVKTRAYLDKQRKGWRYQYTGWKTVYIICPISQEPPRPTYVSLQNMKNEDEVVFLPIEFQESANYKLTMCVPIVYGDFNSEALVEWFEFQKHFGVEKISMHIWNVSQENWKVFEYYRSDGILDIYRLDAPYNISYKFEKNKKKAPQKPYFVEALYATDLVECMLRNNQRSQYIMLIDLDEILVPHKYNNFHELLNDYKEADSIRFPMVNFDVTCNFTVSGEKHFHFQRAFRKEPRSYLEQLPVKSIHKTSNCGMFTQHYCERYLKTPNITLIDYDVMMLRHYRRTAKCTSRDTSNFVEDTRLNRFANSLNFKMTETKNKIFGFKLK